jgi:protocatechuate 3,4-dioxygenase beta subunit
MAKIAGYRLREWGFEPPYLYPAYTSTVLRSPGKPMIRLPHTLSEITGPVYGHDAVRPEDGDLTRNAGTGSEALGERIVVAGRVLDEDGRGVAQTLVEIWQTNSAGRYIHRNDQHPAPLDPNFIGAGRCVTNEKGEYRFLTIRPGAYPWRNHANAWRPAHIHFSLLGPCFVRRLVTQMYFPGDPLMGQDPMLTALPSDAARERLVASYDHDLTEPEWALGFRFDLVVRGREATPFEDNR